MHYCFVPLYFSKDQTQMSGRKIWIVSTQTFSFHWKIKCLHAFRENCFTSSLFYFLVLLFLDLLCRYRLSSPPYCWVFCFCMEHLSITASPWCFKVKGQVNSIPSEYLTVFSMFKAWIYEKGCIFFAQSRFYLFLYFFYYYLPLQKSVKPYSSPFVFPQSYLFAKYSLKVKNTSEHINRCCDLNPAVSPV